jgi:hypothetical protein
MFDSAALDGDQVPDAARPMRTDSELQKMEEIARSEMAKRRRRLGNLTPDQELAVETLLISAVNRISEMVAALEV